MIIKIIFKGTEYDLTNLIEPTSLQVRQTIDGTFDSGGFYIPRVLADHFVGLDMSRPIPRYCDCDIITDNIQYHMLVGESEVNQINGYYQHSISLISRSKMYQNIPLPDLTLTQQSQETSSTQSSTNANTNITEEMKIFCNSFVNPLTGINYFTPQNETTGIKISNTPVALNYTSEGSSTSLIDGLTLKENGKSYNVSFSTDVWNIQSIFEVKTAALLTIEWSLTADTVFIVDMYVNNVFHSELIREYIAPAASTQQNFTLYSYPYSQVTEQIKKVDKVISYTTTAANQTLSFRARTEGEFGFRRTLGSPEYQPDAVFLKNNIVYVTASTETQPFTFKHADFFVDRVIELSEKDIVQDITTKAKLANIVAPETTFNSYDLWKALLYVGSFTGSMPRATLNPLNRQETIAFDFYEEMESLPIQDFVNIQESKRRNGLDGYACAVELNAENILKNNRGGLFPTLSRFTGVRAEGRGQVQITTANLSIHTPYPIDKIYKVLVKGIPVLYANNTVAYDGNTEWDITYRVLAKEHYDILPNNSSYTNADRRTDRFTINNSLYYTQGQNDIGGLSSTGNIAPNWSTPNFNRAIREIVYTLAAIQNAGTIKEGLIDPGTVASDAEIGVYVEYEPYISTRARVYKEDQSGFEKQPILYFNESARVNDAFALGSYAQGDINRSSNTLLEVKGVCQLGQIPKLGTKNSDGYILTEVQLNFLQSTELLVSYYGKYTKDFAVLSEYTGIKSEYRIWEVPKTNTVVSHRRKQDFIWLQTTAPTTSANVMYYVMLDKVWSTIRSDAPLIAAFKSNTNSKKYLLNVDSAAFGNTISWKVVAYDNYSIGSQRYITGGAYYQIDCPYTDVYGEMEEFNIGYYREITAANNAQLNQDLLNIYPETSQDITGGTLYSLTNQPYNKDSREIFSFSVDTTFLSNEPNNVFVFHGFTKYHSLIRTKETTGKILCAAALYVPSKSAVLVDRARIRTTASAAINTTFITITDTSIDSRQGYVFYHSETGEMLLFVRSSNPVQNLFFGV